MQFWSASFNWASTIVARRYRRRFRDAAPANSLTQASPLALRVGTWTTQQVNPQKMGHMSFTQLVRLSLNSMLDDTSNFSPSMNLVSWEALRKILESSVKYANSGEEQQDSSSQGAEYSSMLRNLSVSRRDQLAEYWKHTLFIKIRLGRSPVNLLIRRPALSRILNNAESLDFPSVPQV